MLNLIVAIDGPAASGKSTVSRKVAAGLKCVVVDSGSLYRGLTWKVIQEGISSRDEDAVIRVMETMRMDFFLNAGAVCFIIDQTDPGPAIRSEIVGEQVSAIAAIPRVRTWMVNQLRGMTRFGDLVMEGRDIGTVVFPDAPFKFYLDADPEERARRRRREMAGLEGSSDLSRETRDLNEVKKSLLHRDALDSGRPMAPLTVAADAQVIDTTTMTIDEVVARIVETVQGAGQS